VPHLHLGEIFESEQEQHMAKGKIAKGGLKLGRHKVKRTPAGTAVLYGQALVGNEAARDELGDAYAAARKAYARSSDRRGRPDLGALLEDRKAQRDAGKAVRALRRALRIADGKRQKPRSAKGPVLVVVAVAGAGTAVALNEGLRAKVMAPFGDGDEQVGGEQADPINGAAAA
jgi:hypothetical protein